MLKGGFAWHYKMFDKHPEFAKWQREAKKARRGLWSLDKPQKPWIWRRDNPRIDNKKGNVDDIQVSENSRSLMIQEPWFWREVTKSFTQMRALWLFG